jgi:hypothetical protein
MDFLDAIGWRSGLGKPQLTGSAGGFLSGLVEKFALKVEKTRFDRSSTTKSPQKVCQPVNELKLDH